MGVELIKNYPSFVVIKLNEIIMGPNGLGSGIFRPDDRARWVIRFRVWDWANLRFKVK